MNALLAQYGYPSDTAPEQDSLARVTAVHRERYEIVTSRGFGFARLKAGVYYGGGEEAFPTVGDFVEIQYNPSGDSLIVRTLPRRSFFSRPDVHVNAWEQAVAANFDYVFIVMSLNQNFSLRRLEWYLTTSWQSGALPVVVLTKLDLCEDPTPMLLQAEQTAMGAPVCAVSAHTGQGMDKLQSYLQPGQTIVLLGSSGVGKSSLINALLGQEQMKVSAIREEDGRGRHTTTHRQLLQLPCGALVIDTPGMRELGMWDVTEGLGDTFADVEEFIGRCRFSDCTHQSEPGCAVREALESGQLSPARWESYQKLRREARFSDDKDAYLRQRQQWHKDIARTNRQRKKAGKQKF
ncbi:MAG: ribosome small subunit-dependent GTPase A [Oscillospiraceae bacterium]|nr:ribosome small subunit-dependent GTPase A [Oscillospiraceae bacterium]